MATGSLGVSPQEHLIVDSAAGQASIGEAARVRWEQKLNDAGLRGVQVDSKMMTPDRRTPGCVAAHGTRRHPGTVAIEFSGQAGAMINLCTNKLHLPRLKAVVHMHRT